MENVDVYSNVAGLRVEKPNIQLMLVGKQTHRTRPFGKRMRTTQFCGTIRASNAFLQENEHVTVCLGSNFGSGIEPSIRPLQQNRRNSNSVHRYSISLFLRSGLMMARSQGRNQSPGKRLQAACVSSCIKTYVQKSSTNRRYILTNFR